MNTKKLLSLAVAVAMAASTTATVFAADYGTSGGKAVGTPTIGDGTSAAEPAATVTASAVSDVIKEASKAGKDAVVYITANASMAASVLKNVTAPITLQASNFKMVIDPAKMTESVNINCGIKESSPAAKATFEKFFKEPVATISCAQKGEFGGSVSIDVKPEDLSNIDTSKPMYVYSWNPQTNSYKKMGSAVLLKNGRIRCSVTRGYSLIISNAASFTAK